MTPDNRSIFHTDAESLSWMERRVGIVDVAGFSDPNPNIPNRANEDDYFVFPADDGTHISMMMDGIGGRNGSLEVVKFVKDKALELLHGFYSKNKMEAGVEKNPDFMALHQVLQNNLARKAELPDGAGLAYLIAHINMKHGSEKIYQAVQAGDCKMLVLGYQQIAGYRKEMASVAMGEANVLNSALIVGKNTPAELIIEDQSIASDEVLVLLATDGVTDNIVKEDPYAGYQRRVTAWKTAIAGTNDPTEKVRFRESLENEKQKRSAAEDAALLQIIQSLGSRPTASEVAAAIRKIAKENMQAEGGKFDDATCVVTIN